MERDGLVHASGTRPGPRKPQVTYDLTSEADQLFPQVDGPILHHLLDVLKERIPSEELEGAMRAVGHRLAAAYRPDVQAGTLRDRAEQAITVLGALGDLAELREDDGKLVICSFDCPLTVAVAGHPEVCRLVETFLADIIGVPVPTLSTGANAEMLFRGGRGRGDAAGWRISRHESWRVIRHRLSRQSRFQLAQPGSPFGDLTDRPPSPACRTGAGSSLSFAGHPLRVTRGHPLPIGANLTPGGVNFALICRHATAIRLVLSEPRDPETLTEITLDPRRNRTGEHWHIRVDGLPGEFCYGYRVDGPSGNGHRYDPSIVLLDPASRALSCGRAWGTEGVVPRRSLVKTAMNPDQDDVNPCTPREDTVIYELHVRGFTIDPSSGVRHPGTFAGLMEKIPYLKALGVTAVELLPIDEFDENDCPFVNPHTGERLRNFWGYNTIAYAAPKAAYASNPEEHSAPWASSAGWSGRSTTPGSR